MYSFLYSFTIRVIAEYWAEFPVLYGKSLLVIYFIYSSVSVPVFQFILPSDLEHKFMVAL